MKIVCPNCGRILGDTNKSLDANFNCRGCKKTVPIHIRVVNYDYIELNERRTNDKSK